MDIKENLAENLVRYRKSLNLTQAELAEKLSYSDKAVSKWERGESFPDLYVLKQIADFYGVTIDTLIDDPKKPAKERKYQRLGTKRAFLSLCSVGLVWLVAICCFAFLNIIFPFIEDKWPTWLSFIYALPTTATVLLVLTSVWKKKITTAVVISFLIWTSILSLYLTLCHSLTAPPEHLWEIFLVGIPLQILLIFWSIYRKIR